MIVKQGESRTQEISGQNLKGFAFNIYNIANANNTAPTAPALQNVNVKATLQRSGHQITIFNAPLLWLLLHSNITNPRWGQFHPLIDSNFIVQSPAVGAPGIYVKVGDVYFEPCAQLALNLRASDVLKVELQVNSNTFVTNSSTTLSYIEIKPIHTDDIEIGVPTTNTYVVQASEVSNQYQLGRGVMSSTFLNLDKENTAPVINSMTISSDLFTNQVNTYDLINTQLSNFPKSLYTEASLVDLLINSQRVIDSKEPLNQASLEINYNSSNVTSGNNIVIASSLYTDMKTLQLAQVTREERKDSFLASIKDNPIY